MKLGRIKPNPERLKLIPQLHNYLSLPPAPASCDWSKGITSWGMMLNGPAEDNPPQIPDGIGDCTIAGIAHAIQIFTANTSTEVTVPDSLILDRYESWAGYVLGDPSTDNGAEEITILHRWHKKKHFAGNILIAFADPNVSNLDEIRSAISTFGGVYIGLEVPTYVMNNLTAPGSVWDVEPDDGIDGGHCVFVYGYTSDAFNFISWGASYSMTNSFWTKYVEEAHALISLDFLASTGFDPQGLDLAQLQADLALLQ
jgi:hypothetical protein